MRPNVERDATAVIINATAVIINATVVIINKIGTLRIVHPDKCQYCLSVVHWLIEEQSLWLEWMDVLKLLVPIVIHPVETSQ